MDWQGNCWNDPQYVSLEMTWNCVNTCRCKWDRDFGRSYWAPLLTWDRPPSEAASEFFEELSQTWGKEVLVEGVEPSVAAADLKIQGLTVNNNLNLTCQNQFTFICYVVHQPISNRNRIHLVTTSGGNRIFLLKSQSDSRQKLNWKTDFFPSLWLCKEGWGIINHHVKILCTFEIRFCQ